MIVSRFVERAFEVEAHVFGCRLQIFGKCPVGRFGHFNSDAKIYL